MKMIEGGLDLKRILFICMAFVLLTIPVWAVDNQVVQFDWGTSGSSCIVNSRVGEIRFIFSYDDIQTINQNGGAFINVGLLNNIAPTRRWIVQNMFVSPGSYLSSVQPSAMFGLADISANGIAWTNNYVDVMLTTTPFDYGSAMAGRPFNPAAVIHKGYRVGGINGDSGNSNLVNTIGAWVGFVTTTPTPSPAYGSSLAYYSMSLSSTSSPVTTVSPSPVTTITPVRTTSPATTITPVRTTSPTVTATPVRTTSPTATPGWIVIDSGSVNGTIPAIDEGCNECAPGSVARSIQYMAGRNGQSVPSPQDMKDDLADDMQTDPNNGTQIDDILSGKNTYTGDNGLPINSQIQYGLPMADVINTLNSGGDVEILIGWDGGGGHAAMIISVTQHADGSYTIVYVDDPNQGDGQAENQPHVIHVDPNGNFPGGHIIGFLIETWSPTPTPTRTPAPTPTPARTATPVRTATPTPVRTSTPVRTATVSPIRTATPSPVRTVTPVVSATPVRTITPIRTSSPVRTITPVQTTVPTPVRTTTSVRTVAPTPVSTVYSFPATGDEPVFRYCRYGKIFGRSEGLFFI